MIFPSGPGGRRGTREPSHRGPAFLVGHRPEVLPQSLPQRGHPRRTGGLAVALCLAAALAACGRQAPPPQAAAVPEVSVVTVRAAPAAVTSELPGRVSAVQSAEVRPQISGIVRQRRFTEGAMVKAGDVLYEIDDATYRTAVDNASGTLTQAEATLATAQAKAERYAGLLKIQGVSRQDYDDAVASAKSAAGAVVSDRAALRSARIDLERTRIQAPISGRIGKSSVTAGALVTASQDSALATINDLSAVYVDVTQSSAELLRLKKELAAGRLRQAGDGAEVRLRLEDGSLYPLAGRLAFTDVTVSETTGTVTLRATFPNPDGLLLPNMYVRALLQEGVDEQAIKVPQLALARDAKGNASVKVVDAGGRVATRAVTVRGNAGAAGNAGNDALVAGGLASGDKVLVDSLQTVRDGMQVKAVEAAAATAATAAAPVRQDAASVPAASPAAGAAATVTAAR
ncbi:efflux RND transporter periplasmic adaptor subunit [Cupriavidus sp. USMAHM13]|uniref:efflux RND transporter periplasmic adaptor subunit n=1 Tax=Cupriavidus sp. USMAHM13 TaxID=1389192 RepID=UPI0009F6C621|nr:efflux RND transporter periplasmic adaptor subunit [Cupriavidus sp. USMAHM13]